MKQIQKAREAKIGLEFNIGGVGNIGAVDVKRVLINESGEESFIIAWNKISGTEVSTYVQVFNQFSEPLCDKVLIKEGETTLGNEDVAIINMGNGKYKIGTVGYGGVRITNFGLSMYFNYYEQTVWQELTLNKSENENAFTIDLGDVLNGDRRFAFSDGSGFVMGQRKKRITNNRRP